MSTAKNVLVADDSEGDFVLLRTGFRAAGFTHQLYHAQSGAKAIACLKGESACYGNRCCPLPDLLIVDLNMPNGDGFAVLEFLRTRRDLQLSSVVLTGWSSPADLAKAIELGAAEAFSKPPDVVGLMVLAQTIHHRWLSLRQCD